MDQIARRAAIQAHFEAIGRDEPLAGEIYAEDAILDYPQGGERIRGKANIIATRAAYPGPHSTFELNECTGDGDLWVADLTLRFDNVDPHRVAAVLEFHGDLVWRERIYIADPWDPPAYRARWAERLEER